MVKRMPHAFPYIRAYLRAYMRARAGACRMLAKRSKAKRMQINLFITGVFVFFGFGCRVRGQNARAGPLR